MTQKKKNTKNAILKAGLELASKIGLEGISIGRLATEVHMSKSGLFAHFVSKEQLQMDILDYAAAHFTDFVILPSIKLKKGLPRLHSLLDKWLEWSLVSAPGGCIFYSASVEFDDRPGPVKEHLKKIHMDWIGTLEKAVRLSAETGDLSIDSDCRQAAFEIYSAAIGYYHFHRLIGDSGAEERRKRAIEKIIAAYRPAMGATG